MHISWGREFLAAHILYLASLLEVEAAIRYIVCDNLTFNCLLLSNIHSAQDLQPQNAWYRIVHRESNRSLDGDGIFYINSANQSIRLIDWSDSPYQRWRFNRIDDNYYAIINNATGKYLDGGSFGSDGNKRVSTFILVCPSTCLHLSLLMGSGAGIASSI